MLKLVLQRAFQSIGLLFFVSVVTFILIHAAPGGPAMLANPDLSAADASAMRESMGLDDPMVVQYWRWLTALFSGDFGRSYNSVTSVTTLLADRIPNTLLLTGVALLIAVCIAIPLGVISAIKSNSFIDRFITGFCFFGTSMPVFWLGIMLIVFFSVRLQWLPTGGMRTIGQESGVADLIKHMILPVSVLTLTYLAELTRYTRSGMISVLREDYIRTAYSKGLTRNVVITRHAFKNAFIPVITILGVMLPRAISGAAITEAVFSWPGMGSLAVEAAYTRDYPVVMGVTLAVALLVAVTSFVTDVANATLDPRIRNR